MSRKLTHPQGRAAWKRTGLWIAASVLATLCGCAGPISHVSSPELVSEIVGQDVFKGESISQGSPSCAIHPESHGLELDFSIRCDQGFRRRDSSVEYRERRHAVYESFLLSWRRQFLSNFASGLLITVPLGMEAIGTADKGFDSFQRSTFGTACNWILGAGVAISLLNAYIPQDSKEEFDVSAKRHRIRSGDYDTILD